MLAVNLKKNCMADSVGGRDETNPKLPLATLGTKFCNLRYVSSKSKKNCMAGSVCGQDETNPKLPLAT